MTNMAQIVQQYQKEYNKLAQEVLLQKIGTVVGKEVVFDEAEELLRSKQVKVSIYGNNESSYYLVQNRLNGYYLTYKIAPDFVDGEPKLKIVDMSMSVGGNE